VFREPDFETLVKSIVYQQLSGKVAAVIFERLVRAAVGGGPLADGGRGAGRRAAPAEGKLTPERILKLRPSRMRALGLSTQKTAYIRDLARHTQDGRLVFQELGGLADADAIERLTRVKGIGQWTAQMFLMFALRRTDVLPVADLGIRNAMRRAYGMAELPQAPEIERIAERWRPYCTVASWYLWRSLEGDANL